MATQKTKEELINELNSILEPGNVLVENEDYFVVKNEIQIMTNNLASKLKKSAKIDAITLCRRLRLLPFYSGRSGKTLNGSLRYVECLRYTDNDLITTPSGKQ